MPIYAYKCESCGHRQDVLQRISDAPLTQCPACGASSFVKQVTAAGFQLKGSGWYVTDFRGGKTAAPADGAAEGIKSSGDADKPSKPETAVKSEKSEKSDGSAKAKSESAASPAPAAPVAGSGKTPPSSGST